jgi:hypothetical protein
VPTVRESGEYAVRGGLVDLFPASAEAPLRFDFFGSQLESIRTFDPDSQRTTGTLKRIDLTPMSEVVLNEETIRRFRQNYTATFGGNTVDDTLYASVSGGSRYSGTEHWLPFFYDHLDTSGRLCRRRTIRLRRPGGGGLCRPRHASSRLLRSPRDRAANAAGGRGRGALQANQSPNCSMPRPSSLQRWLGRR